MLKFKCFKCQEELNEPGAILFAPPEKFQYNEEDVFYSTMVQKYHICTKCYGDLVEYIFKEKKEPF